MAELENVTAAPQTIRLAGRDITMRPLTMKDWGEVQRWLRQHYRQQVEEVAEGLPPSERTAYIVECRKKELGLRVGTAEGDKLLCTFEGLVLLLHLSVRRDHPELTVQALEDMVHTTDLPAVLDAFTRVNALEQVTSKGGPGPFHSTGDGTQPPSAS